mmetsp:Transcript_15280/g.17388  ORF Transcript_15280/g.17388 Transcript_15280/m.17388 type:complete len:89 (-) Transcript_15280:248-514(-)
MSMILTVVTVNHVSIHVEQDTNDGNHDDNGNDDNGYSIVRFIYSVDYYYILLFQSSLCSIVAMEDDVRFSYGTVQCIRSLFTLGACGS